MENNNDTDDFGIKKRKKQALGRGLDALIPGGEPVEKEQKDFFMCDIDTIQPNRYQPRMKFAEEELEELSRSVKEQGVIQPLLVRVVDNGFELIAGERRLKAAKMAGLMQVPVVAKDVTDENQLVLSIIENIQRENLNPLEESEAYHHLISEFNLTQEQAAQRVGKSRSAVTNLLRLRQLSKQIKASLLDDTISMGHARALLGLESEALQVKAWREVVSKKLSVRETENLVKRLVKKDEEKVKPPPDAEEAYFTNLSEDLSRFYGTKVQIIRRGKKGKVEIEFYDDSDLDRLLGILKR